jgi:hypothetical protein
MRLCNLQIRFPRRSGLRRRRVGPVTMASWAAVFSLALLSGRAYAARDPLPAAEIPLNQLGYESPRPELLAAGNAMATVDYVDATHLLVTFGLRSLIPRVADDPPDDDDRLVGAFEVELPSGKVLAHTVWHLHDRGQYLWNLGNGRFLLRIRDHLALLEPELATKPEEALREHTFLHFDRQIVAINVSAEHDLLMVQTSAPVPPAVILADGDSDASARRSPVQINFYRLVAEPTTTVVVSAGAVRASGALALPVSALGFMRTAEVKRDQWQFEFHSTAGAISKLAKFGTTCSPRVTLVSNSEFIAFGCKGDQDRIDIAGFDMTGDFMWQQTFFDTHVNPSFAFAPVAGRFALGRTLVNSSVTDRQIITTAEVNGQDLRVYQTWSGKILLELSCTPPMRSGQNFALSPDGLHLAVLREERVEHKATDMYDAYVSREAAVAIYDLPPLSAEDRKALLARPQPAAAPLMPRVDLAIESAENADRSGGEGSDEARSAAAPAFPPPTPAQSAGLPSGPADGTAPARVGVSADTASAGYLGDAEPEQRQKPPTLYAPGEVPQAETQQAPSQQH